jgi:hypothetical protein
MLQKALAALRVRRCPRCQNEDVCRSHYRWREALLLPLFIRPWRCRYCGQRFWTPRWLFRFLDRL